MVIQLALAGLAALFALLFCAGRWLDVRLHGAASRFTSRLPLWASIVAVLWFMGLLWRITQ